MTNDIKSAFHAERLEVYRGEHHVEDNVSLAVFSPLYQGLLTDKYLGENIPADSKTVGNKLADLDAKIADLESTSNVFNANTHFDFPSIGSVNMIYKAYKEKKTYQWNAEELRYEALDVDILEDISVINGGAANG